jgi:hypothetical protein
VAVAEAAAERSEAAYRARQPAEFAAIRKALAEAGASAAALQEAEAAEAEAAEAEAEQQAAGGGSGRQSPMDDGEASPLHEASARLQKKMEQLMERQLQLEGRMRDPGAPEVPSPMQRRASAPSRYFAQPPSEH